MPLFRAVCLLLVALAGMPGSRGLSSRESADESPAATASRLHLGFGGADALSLRLQLMRQLSGVLRGEHGLPDSESLVEMNITSQCVRDIDALFPPSSIPPFNRNLTVQGALMYDAFGKLPSDILSLPPSVQMMGDYDECKRIARAFAGNGGVDTHYCYAQGFENLEKNTSGISANLVPAVSLGLCLPLSCSEANVTYVLQNITNNRLKGLFVKVEAHCAHATPWSIWAITTVAICGTMLALIILGSTLHMYQMARSPPFTRLISTVQRSMSSDKLDEPYSREGEPLLTAQENLRQADIMSSSSDAATAGAGMRSRGVRWLITFSLLRNFPRLFDTKRRRDGIGCFDGMRTISMLWVICGHNWLWIFKNWPQNMVSVVHLSNRDTFQFIANTAYAVDTFFYISGFLVSYSVLNLLDARRKFPWTHFYVHRYLRLTPTYMFVMLVFVHMSGLLGEGPLFFHEQEVLPSDGCYGLTRTSCGCVKYWWANFLYVQNFYPSTDQNNECMGWTWYLANDMQMYLVSPFILIAMHRWPKQGMLLWTALFLCSVCVPFALSYIYHLSANPLPDVTGVSFHGLRDGAGNVNSLINNKPYCRMAPYLIGILMGYAYRHFRWSKDSLRLSLIVQAIGWFFFFALFGLIIYGVTGTSERFYKHGNSQFEDALWISLSRPLWAMMLSWLTFACLSGYGGFVNYFLSSGMWLPLSRLTYGAYLIHPVVLNTFYSTFEVPIYYQDSVALYFYIGNVVMSYAVAAIVCLAVEFPFAELEKLFLR